MLEVDDWAEAQVAQREQTARPLLEACIKACRLVRSPQDCMHSLRMPSETIASTWQCTIITSSCSEENSLAQSRVASGAFHTPGPRAQDTPMP